MFVMVIPRRPISANRGPNPKFSQALETAARNRNAQTIAGPLYARIIWFHKYPTTQDADNIAKRILDSLKGVVYVDDNAVTHCLTARVDATVDYELSDAPASDADYDDLLQLLADDDQRDVLYVEIGHRKSTTVSFGEVI